MERDAARRTLSETVHVLVADRVVPGMQAHGFESLLGSVRHLGVWCVKKVKKVDQICANNALLYENISIVWREEEKEKRPRGLLFCAGGVSPVCFDERAGQKPTRAMCLFGVDDGHAYICSPTTVKKRVWPTFEKRGGFRFFFFFWRFF